MIEQEQVLVTTLLEADSPLATLTLHAFLHGSSTHDNTINQYKESFRKQVRRIENAGNKHFPLSKSTNAFNLNNFKFFQWVKISINVSQKQFPILVPEVICKFVTWRYRLTCDSMLWRLRESKI